MPVADYATRDWKVRQLGRITNVDIAIASTATSQIKGGPGVVDGYLQIVLHDPEIVAAGLDNIRFSIWHNALTFGDLADALT